MLSRIGITIVFSIVLLSPCVVQAQSNIVRIEEDWELVVTHPDEQRDAPQVTVSMAPFSNNPNLHLQVNLNYALKPDFARGGIQIRIQNNEEPVAHLHRNAGVQLSHASEVVSWTTAIQKTENGYAFGVATGSSSTWGSFGGPEYFLSLRSHLASTGLESYSPSASLENSGATFAGNRVTSLKLKRFRIFDIQGLVSDYEVDKSVE